MSSVELPISPSLFNATLIERHDLSEALSVVRIRPDGGELPPFEAGQYCTVGLPKDAQEQAAYPPNDPRRLVRRAYSIASPPHRREELELLVIRVDQGQLTTRLWELGPGARLFIDPKIRGEFTLREVPAGSDLVMVATGTGLAPYLSILREHWHRPGWPLQTASDFRRWRRYVIIHGARKEQDLAYRAELEALAHDDPDFHYIPILSGGREGDGWAGLRGRVPVALDPPTFRQIVGAELDPRTAHVFLCGNPSMITDVQKLLEGRGFITHSKRQPGNIHFERYW